MTRKRRDHRPDGRTAAARRTRSLVAAFVDDVVGEVTPAQRELIGQAARLIGDADAITDPVMRVTALNSAHRLLASAGVRSAQRRQAPGPDSGDGGPDAAAVLPWLTEPVRARIEAGEMDLSTWPDDDLEALAFATIAAATGHEPVPWHPSMMCEPPYDLDSEVDL